MTATQATSEEGETGIAACLRGVSGLLWVIEQRVLDVPEDGTWLEHKGHDVLMELERYRMSAAMREQAS